MIALFVEKEEAGRLISHMPFEEQGPLAHALEEIKKTENREKRMIDEIRRLALEARKSPLGFVHPDWILEALKKEAPRTVAAVLRHLPGQQVAHVLSGLPPATLERLPPLSETFALDPEIVQVLRRRFEQNFRFARSSPDLASLPFVKLEMLFRELGFREAAMAFTTLNEKTVGLILRRLSPRDAALLKERMGRKEEWEEERVKQAQTHVLSIDLEKSAASLILELGFFVLSKAVCRRHMGGVEAIARKFPIHEGRLLLKYVERNLPLNSEKTATRYENEILSALTLLEKE